MFLVLSLLLLLFLKLINKNKNFKKPDFPSTREGAVKAFLVPSKDICLSQDITPGSNQALTWAG